MNESPGQPEIIAALRSLAAEDISVAPPQHIEANLHAEFAAKRSRPASRPFPVWLAAAVALAVICAVLFHFAHPEPHASTAPFVQIPFIAPPAPYERTEIIRAAVPVAALVTAGFDVHVPNAGDALSADLLIGQDGRVLAIRLVTGRAYKFGEEN